MKRSACRSCGAPIVWAVTVAHGRRMPVDADPVDGGTVMLSDDDPPLADVLPPGQLPMFDGASPTYTSHFATCPNADQHRRTDA